MPTIAVGVDIGQKRDPTAIAVVEPEFRDVNGRREDYYLVRFLERQPLGTPYPQVVSRVQTVVNNVREQVARAAPPSLFGPPLRPSIQLFVDATGVGQPVVDLLKGVGVRVHAVYFTHGDRRTTQQDGSISLGKAWLCASRKRHRYSCSNHHSPMLRRSSSRNWALMRGQDVAGTS